MAPRADLDPRDVLVFLHGRFGTAAQWRAVIAILGDRYRCLAPDLPGLGGSLLDYAAWVRGLAERQAPRARRVFLIGHDSGAAIALLGAVSGEWGTLAGITLLNAMDLTAAPRGLSPGWGGLRAAWLLSRSLSRCRCLATEDQAALWGPWRQVASRRALLGTLQALHDAWPKSEERALWARKLSVLQTPVLVLRGSLDPLNSREMGLNLLRLLPDTLYFERESCGHWPLLEDPEWVAPKLQTFFFQTKAA
jgi:pimeloyl-ACP methyl ester carboxylesterase